MASENKTISEIVSEMRRDAIAADAWCETHGEMASAASVLNGHADSIEAAHLREVTELREFSNDMRTWFRLYYSCGSDPKSKWWRSCATCRRKSCPIHKWRKALEGANHEGK